jgi:hypothetical protein
MRCIPFENTSTDHVETDSNFICRHDRGADDGDDCAGEGSR